jgi:tripartite-type tricarboxylate transporter receptor subunit TctC
MPVVGGASMKLSHRRHFLCLAGAAVLPALPRPASALDYPTRPVRIIVGFAAGGGVDMTARLIGQWLSGRFGQQFVIEDRPGAGGNIGTEIVVNAPADGYTLLLATAPNVVNTTLYEKLSFNFTRDIVPCGEYHPRSYGHSCTPFSTSLHCSGVHRLLQI